MRFCPTVVMLVAVVVIDYVRLLPGHQHIRDAMRRVGQPVDDHMDICVWIFC